MKKFFLGLMISLMICGVSAADILYTTTSGNMGLIEITSSRDVAAPSVKYQGAGQNPLVDSYWNGDGTSVILIDRTDDVNNTSGDSAFIFSSTNLTTPANSERKTLTGIYNTQDVAFSLNGRSIFLASYENGTITEFNTYTFKPEHSYTHKQNASDDIYTPHALWASAGYSFIYGLFNVNPTKNIFLRFDGQLSRNFEEFAQYTINTEVSSVASLTNNRYAFACSDGVRVLSGGKISMLLSSDNPVKAICRDRSNGFYFIAQSLSQDVIAHYSTSNGVSYLTEIESGSHCSLVRDTSHRTLAAISGNKILLYNMNDDSLLAEFDSQELGGGEPVSVAANSASGYIADNSGGSCEISGVGMILLLVCAKKILRRK